MSASLVGSEMCIRDRLRRLPRTLKNMAGPPRGECICIVGLPPGDMKRPVSYTHLTLPTICSV
eukprot:13992156-Alexandrium_andersonii.AAC.1